MSTHPLATDTGGAPGGDRTHWLYVAVVVAVTSAVLVGTALTEDFAVQLQWLGDTFVSC